MPRETSSIEHEMTEPPTESRRGFIKKLATAAGFVMAEPLSKLAIEPAPTKTDTFRKTDVELPVETFEDRAEGIIERAKKVVETKNYQQFLDIPFLAAALYYSDNFRGDLKTPSQEADEPIVPARQIIIRIMDSITPDIRAGYFQFLNNAVDQKIGHEDKDILRKPLANIDFGKGENHSDAVDLFTKEGEAVKTMTRGIVVLSEREWSANDPISSTSPKGGNTVIVYNPERNAFFRYCHLNQVNVNTREVVQSGTVLGTVGHTGTNASKPGHGNHLHLEINVVSDFSIRSTQARDLKQEIASAD